MLHSGRLPPTSTLAKAVAYFAKLHDRVRFPLLNIPLGIPARVGSPLSVLNSSHSHRHRFRVPVFKSELYILVNIGKNLYNSVKKVAINS